MKLFEFLVVSLLVLILLVLLGLGPLLFLFFVFFGIPGVLMVSIGALAVLVFIALPLSLARWGNKKIWLRRAEIARRWRLSQSAN